MTEYFRITGLNLIPFDARVTGEADTRYALGASPRGMDEPLSESEIRSTLSRLPIEIRGHALKRGISKISFPFTIKGSTDADMEDARHDLTETLEDAKLYIETQGARGTRAILQSKSNLAVQQSYKTIYYGEAMEVGGRAVLGAPIKQHFLLNMQMVLYCEPYWRPASAVTLGPNEIYCPSFEENADSGTPNEVADNWTLVATPIPTWESTIVLHGCRSQKLVTDAVNEGIISTAFASGAVNRPAVAYAWIYKSAGGEVRVQMWEGGVARATALLSTAGWQTAVGKSGNTWYRVVVSGTMPNNANHQLRIIADNAATTFYVDKCFWKWDTLLCPDEWISHWLIYNHHDALWQTPTVGVAHVGDAGHINYLDTDDLKGDIDARTWLRLTGPNTYRITSVHLFRRSGDTLCKLVHVREAQDRTVANAWADTADAACSGGTGGVANAKLLDSANATGFCYWVLWPAAVIGIPQSGAFSLRARLKTNDAVNTLVRYRIGGAGDVISGPWVRIPSAGKWFKVALGNVRFPIKAGLTGYQINIYVEYQKDAVDTVEFDWLMVAPVDETAGALYSLPPSQFIETPDELWYTDVTDFIGVCIKVGGVDGWKHSPYHVGNPPGLAPVVENRWMFAIGRTDGGIPFVDLVHEDALAMTTYVSYLPQYISPLE